MHERTLQPAVRDLCAAVRAATAEGRSLCLIGGDSKRFYGRAPEGEPLHVGVCRGVIDYRPEELVVTAWAGTPVGELETILGEHGQMLGFEPPRRNGATVGGMVACGLSGPRRPFAGSVRDHVLGVRLIDGQGEVLTFGGQVMKNVAGYDVSRLMAGAMGTLGVLLDVSLRVVPRPEGELFLSGSIGPEEGLHRMRELNRQPLPLSGACHLDGTLYLRLSGAPAALAAVRDRLKLEEHAQGHDWWEDLREWCLDFFRDRQPLWRLSVPPASPPPGAGLIDWGGAQYWLKSAAPMEEIRAAAVARGGHATLFRGGDRRGQAFHPLPPPLLALHSRLKRAFDHAGIFNPGRLYADL